MKKPPIATVINFCSNEARFIKACIEQCRFFSRQIIVPVCDHLFNGEEENQDLLERIYSSFPDCLFVQYPFALKKVPLRILRAVSLDHFWHCVSRFVGVQFIDQEIERVLFLDADEVPDGKKFCEWLDTDDYGLHSTMKLANYWYFREPRFQSLQFEDSIVLAHRQMLSPSILIHQNERDAIYDLLPNPKRRSVMGLDGQPMFHHFSWVRTKDEMVNKVRSWGHRKDRDWMMLVEKEFSSSFSMKDFVHGYSYREYPPPFDISMETVNFPAKTGPLNHLKQLTDHELIRLLNMTSDGYFQRIWKNLFSNEPLSL